MKSIDIGLIEEFDRYLKVRGLIYNASIVGGAAIMLVANGQRATGDIDSLQRIPDDIRHQIQSFAKEKGLAPTWFNDHVSRNFTEFVRKGDELFSQVVYEGEALKLYLPSLRTLLLSKIYPMLDRPSEGKDFQDIESLVVAKIIGRNELEAAISAFEDNIRFEDKNLQRPSWLLSKMLRDYLNEAFDEKLGR